MTCGCAREHAICAAPDEPIVCTLGAVDQAARASEFRAVFEHLIATSAFSGGFRWTFRTDPGLHERLSDLAEREHACCRFFDFRVFQEGEVLIWETRASDDAAIVKNELMRLPAALEGAEDVASLKRVFVEAGIAFASDQAPP
jgi:hypothetical protein